VFATSLRLPVASIWDRFGLWSSIAVVTILAAYTDPILDFLAHHRCGSPPYQPF